jgi:tetratricopeptide (TPR) repeat protein
MRNLLLSALVIGLLAAAGPAAGAGQPAAAPSAPQFPADVPAAPAPAKTGEFAPKPPDAPPIENLQGGLGAEAPASEPLGPNVSAEALHHFLIGRLYMSQADNAKAAAEFREAVALAPGAARFWLDLGLTAHDSGRGTEAIAAFDKAISLAPDDPAALYFRARVARDEARVAANQGDAAKAADIQKMAAGHLKHLLDTAAYNSPFRILAMAQLAQLLQETKDLAGAIAQYESLLEALREPQGYFSRYPDIVNLFQNQIQLRDQLARLYLVHNDSDKAIALFQDLMKEAPDSAPAIMNLIYMAYFQKKDYPAARTWARRMIEAKPEDGGGYQRLAETFKAEGKADLVIPEFEQYHRGHPANRTAALQLAEAYKTAGRTDDAAALYQELLGALDKTQPSAVAAAIRLAEIEVQANRPVEALAALAAVLDPSGPDGDPVRARIVQIIATAPDAAALYKDAQRLAGDDVKAFGPFVIVGLLAEYVKQSDEAMVLYDKAIARDPKAMIPYTQKAGLLLQQKHMEEALAVYESAIKAGVRVGPESQRKMGMILEYLGQPKEALVQYRLAHAAAPMNKVYWYGLTTALARTGNLDEAEKELKDILKIDPREDEAHAQLALVYVTKGDLAAAEKSAAQAAALKPEAITPKALLIDIRIEQKQFGEAERLAREILKDHPDAVAVRLKLGTLLMAQKKYQEAVDELQAILTADARNVTVRYVLAGVYSRLGDGAASEKQLERVLADQPGHPAANNDLGYQWADRGVRLPQAEKMIREALKSDPQSPSYLDSLGWVLYKQGKFEDAVKALLTATTAAPELDGVLWDHLGDAYWQLKKKPEAVKAWETAAKLLKAAGGADRAADLDRVEKKVQSVQAGQAPAVAPLAAKEDAGSGPAKAPESPRP